MMAIRMFVISSIAIKVVKKVTGHFSFGGHLGFQNGRHFNTFWPIFQLLSSSGAQNGGNTYAYDAKG